MITRVCRLVWDYPFEGKSTYGLQPVFVGLSEAQVKQGYDVHVVSAENNGPPEEVVNGVKVHRVRPPFSLNSLRLVRKLVGPGSGWVVHAHATCGIALTATKYLRPFPLVCHVHGTSKSHHTPFTLVEGGKTTVKTSSMKASYHMLRERVFWSSADRVLTVSEASKDDVTDFYHIPDQRVRVVLNGVDETVFEPSREPAVPGPISSLQGRRIILYVGHFGVRKGIFVLLRAMALVRKEVPEAHLVCIGGTPKWLGSYDFVRALREIAASSGVADCVTFLDAVPHAELVDYYLASEIFALPSYYETFSKVSVEAMACGKPVVATDSGGLREVVDQNETGLLVKFGSSTQLAHAIVTLLQDRNMAQEMGKKGRAKVEAKYTWNAVARRVSQVYAELSD